jgi:hypothetical protein
MPERRIQNRRCHCHCMVCDQIANLFGDLFLLVSAASGLLEVILYDLIFLFDLQRLVLNTIPSAP